MRAKKSDKYGHYFTYILRLWCLQMFYFTYACGIHQSKGLIDFNCFPQRISPNKSTNSIFTYVGVVHLVSLPSNAWKMTRVRRLQARIFIWLCNWNVVSGLCLYQKFLKDLVNVHSVFGRTFHITVFPIENCRCLQTFVRQFRITGKVGFIGNNDNGNVWILKEDEETFVTLDLDILDVIQHPNF